MTGVGDERVGHSCRRCRLLEREVVTGVGDDEETRVGHVVQALGLGTRTGDGVAVAVRDEPRRPGVAKSAGAERARTRGQA